MYSPFGVAFYSQKEVLILIFAFIIADGGSDAVQTAKMRGDHNGNEEAARMKRKMRLRFIHKISLLILGSTSVCLYSIRANMCILFSNKFLRTAPLILQIFATG